MFIRRGQNLKRWLFLLPLLVCPAILVWAQDDPFGIKVDKPATPSGSDTAKPATPADEDQEKDPIVLAVRDSNPTDPTGWMRALRLMIDIERFDEASKYLQSLSDATLSDQQSFELQRQVGTGFLVELSGQEQLGDQAPRLARTIVDGAGRYARDPVRINGLISELDDPSIQRRTTALTELKAIGEAGITALVGRLAADGESLQPVIQDTLIALGPSIVQPMVAGLSSDSPIVRETAMNVLGARRATQATVWLVRPALAAGESDEEKLAARDALLQIGEGIPSQGEGIQWVYRLWKYLDEGRNLSQPDAFGQVESWRWDDAQQTLVWEQVPVAIASATAQLRLAEDLYALAPENPEFLQLVWTGRLEFAKANVGFARRLTSGDLDGEALPPPELINNILASGLVREDVTSAIAAVELLAEVGDASLLESASGEAVPIVEALRHSDRRLRLSAVQTILGWQPQRSFSGANRVAEALFYFVSSQGQPRVLIGHPGQQMNQTLVGLLAEVGYQADATRTGRELFFQACVQPDYEAILISDAVDSPEILELVQQLRKDPRTSRIPIGLLPRLENAERAKRIARDYERILVFPWPYQPDTAKFELAELAAIADVDWPTPQQRLEQAILSMELLINVADQYRVFGFEDLHQRQEQLFQAMYNSNLSQSAIQVVGHLATPEAQQALVDYASQESLPIELREAAVDAFGIAVSRRGILLTTRELRSQYARYNESQFSDPATQQVLGRILDILENPGSLSSK